MLSAAITAIGLLAGAAQQSAQPTCAVTRSTIFYERLADLPAEIRAEVASHGAIADAGQPFNEYDFDVEPDLPFRRFILAGRSDGNWFVWLRHGGYDRHEHVLGYRPLYSRVDQPPTLRLDADFRGEPCVAINAFLNGVGTNLRDGPGER